MDISYIDIAVARSFEAAISSWYDSLEKSKERPFRGFSKMLAPVAGVLARVAAIFSAAVLLAFLFLSEIDTVGSVYQYGLYSAVALMLANVLSLRIAAFVERSIERRGPLSALLLSKCDGRLLTAQNYQVWKSLGSSLLGVLGSILVGLITAYIGRFVGLN